MSTVTKATFLDAALAYAKTGWNVFPLAEYGKEPRISVRDGGKGCHDATTDKNQITTWWTRWPNANVGVHCVQFFALDVDPKHNGPDALAGLIRTYGELPDTLRQTSGSGGTHYLFTSPKGMFIKNRSGFYPGLDTRAYGGYIVAAPSIHPDTGESYKWDNWGTPIAESPGWLLELIKASKESFKQSERTDSGSRDIDDAALAGYLFNCGMKEDEVFRVLQDRNNDPARRDVPLPTNEIWKTVRSIGRRDIRTPAGLRQAIHDTAIAVRQERPETPPDQMWEERLVRSKTLIPKNVLVNAEAALTHSPFFCNSLAFDQLSCEIKLTRNVVDPISGKTISGLQAGVTVDEHITREITSVAQRLITSVTFSEDTIADGIQLVARRNSFHPIQDYLNSLVWDGTARIDTWLIDHIGVEDDADGYARGVGRRWLISAVGRAIVPGCKADCALIIEGPQGIGKSPALAILAGQKWFKDSPIDFKSKDKFGSVNGVWIYELGEFDQYRNADAATIKNFVSSQYDTYRPPYARGDVKQPRGCVFVGTTNKDKYLVDETGDKRFWPVKSVRHTKANPIKLKRLEAERDQIWAEAVRAHYNGEPAFIDMPNLMAAHERQARERHDTEDTWQEYILNYMDSVAGKRHGINTGEILLEAINKPPRDQKTHDRDRVKRILLNHGWVYKSYRPAPGKLPIKGWTKPDGQDRLIA